MIAISKTERLGLVKPSINDEVHQTIYDLSQNFQILDEASEIHKSSIPTSGYWMKGQKIWNTEVDIGSNLGWINIREGMSAPTWTSLKNYTVGDLIAPTDDNGHYYVCIQTGYSGVNEPIFPTLEESTVEDIFGSVTWQAGVQREVNDIVVPTFSNNRFYVCTVAGVSGSSEPDWSLVDGGQTNDGDVVWVGYRICVWKEEGVASKFRPFGEVG